MSDFKKFCNALRCPLCNSQLDGNVHRAEAHLYCVENNSEYTAEYQSLLTIPIAETLSFWYTQYQYKIYTLLESDLQTYDITVNRFNLDTHPDKIYQTREMIINFQSKKNTFFHKRMEESVFLNKLKTIITFS
jgi:hypothetical protein